MKKEKQWTKLQTRIINVKKNEKDTNVFKCAKPETQKTTPNNRFSPAKTKKNLIQFNSMTIQWRVSLFVHITIWNYFPLHGDWFLNSLFSIFVTFSFLPCITRNYCPILLYSLLIFSFSSFSFHVTDWRPQFFSTPSPSPLALSLTNHLVQSIIKFYETYGQRCMCGKVNIQIITHHAFMTSSIIYQLTLSPSGLSNTVVSETILPLLRIG